MDCLFWVQCLDSSGIEKTTLRIPKTSSATFTYLQQIANVTEIQGVRFYVRFQM